MLKSIIGNLKSIIGSGLAMSNYDTKTSGQTTATLSTGVAVRGRHAG